MLWTTTVSPSRTVTVTGAGVCDAPPVAFTPLKSDALLRLLICDLVGEDVTRESMTTLRADIADIQLRLDDTESSARQLPHREKYLLMVTGFLRQTSFGPDELRQFDLSLAVPFLGAGAVPLFADALAMAPSTKLLYGSDGFSIPELHWLGARWGRRTLAEALEGWGAWGLPDTELELVAERVLYRNALALYALTLDPPASTRAGS